MKRSGKEIFLGVLGGFFSAILSIIFVVMAFSLPVYYSVAGLLQPKTITTVIQSIDYAEILKESVDFNKTIEDLGLDIETADEIIKSDAVGGLLEDCAGKLTNILGDAGANLNDFNVSFLKELVDEHADNILSVVEEKVEIPIEKDFIKNELNNIIDTNAGAIDEVILNLEPVKQTIKTYDTITQAVQNTLKWQYALGLALIEALFLGLIYLMRKKTFGGFIWIAVDTGIVGLLVSVVFAAISSRFIKEIIAGLPSFTTGIVDSVLSSAETKLLIALSTCFGLMILSIVACVVLRIRKKKIAEATPITTEIPETL